jgi:hypothetical protein
MQKVGGSNPLSSTAVFETFEYSVLLYLSKSVLSYSSASSLAIMRWQPVRPWGERADASGGVAGVTVNPWFHDVGGAWTRNG